MVLCADSSQSPSPCSRKCGKDPGHFASVCVLWGGGVGGRAGVDEVLRLSVELVKTGMTNCKVSEPCKIKVCYQQLSSWKSPAKVIRLIDID